MSKTIAIIEDEEGLVKAIESELKYAGYKTISATNGKDGLSLMKNKKPDLVLLDILMPKLDGYGVLEKLRKDKKLKRVPVIVLSNLGHENDIKKATGLGAVDYFIKSATNLQDLPKKIEKHL